MSARPSRPVRRALPWVGLVLLVVSGALTSWSAFELARGPGSCTVAGTGCGEDFVVAIFVALAVFLLLMPLGVVLGSARVARSGAAGSALVAGGAAAGVWSARFVAGPITESTIGTWIVTALLGVLALVALGRALGPAPSGPDRLAISRAVAASPAPARSRIPEAPADQRHGNATRAGAARSGAHAGGAGETPRPEGPVTGIPALHALLVHGLASGRLGCGPDRGSRLASREQVEHLIDLHRRGVLGDEDLALALVALRDD